MRTPPSPFIDAFLTTEDTSIPGRKCIACWPLIVLASLAQGPPAKTRSHSDFFNSVRVLALGGLEFCHIRLLLWRYSRNIFDSTVTVFFIHLHLIEWTVVRSTYSGSCVTLCTHDQDQELLCVGYLISEASELLSNTNRLLRPFKTARAVLLNTFSFSSATNPHYPHLIKGKVRTPAQTAAPFCSSWRAAIVLTLSHTCIRTLHIARM